MFNGSAFNRLAFNAAASVLLLTAATSWSAEATVTTATALHTHGGKAAISGSAAVSLVGQRTTYPVWHTSANGTLVAGANIAYSASGLWSTELSFTGYTLRMVPAYAGFDTSATFHAIPNARLAGGQWTAGSAVVSFDPTKDGSLSGKWAPGGQWFAGEALVTRYVESGLLVGGDLWIEPTLSAEGVTYHEGYTFHDAGALLENANHLTATFTSGQFTQAGAEWQAKGHGVFAGGGPWTNAADWLAAPEKTAYATAQLLPDPATLTIDATHEKSATAAIAASADILVKGAVKRTASLGLSVSSDIAFTPLRTARVRGKIYGTAVINPVTAVVTRWAFADWSGAASQMGGAVVVNTREAPPGREFFVAQEDRHFILGEDPRIFEVAE
ncbi:MAG: hypothetical protein WC997_02430 [Porticoccaceae bacterium]